jgi:hypothetical protein
LLDDVGERTNLAPQNPSIVSRLSAALAESNAPYVTGYLSPQQLEAGNWVELPNRTETWRGYYGPCYVKKQHL